MTSSASIGSHLPRLDGFAKVTGRARFSADLAPAGTLSACILRSPHAHARIRSLDDGPALATAGVVTVLTAADLDPRRNRFGHFMRDRPIVAVDRVRHEGEPVAAVAALDPDTARDAAERVVVDYEPLAAVTDCTTALSPGAPRVHPRGNRCAAFAEEEGDVEAALADADIVVDGTYTFPRVFHFFLEPHTVTAVASADGITVWSPAQHPYIVRAELAHLFAMPLHRVRIVSPQIGGGFGGKSFTLLEPLVAALALKAGRPVQLVCSLEESFRTTCRHPALLRLRTAAARDGRLLARVADILLDTGAYADNGPAVAARAAVRVLGPYRWAAYRTRCTAVYTHSVPAGSYRAIGAPQAAWGGESQMDELAARLGLDPLELRRRNLPRRGQRIQTRRKPMDADLEGDLSRLSVTVEARPAGVAIACSGAGSSAVATALCRLHGDGSATVLAASVEMGQGVRMVLARIVGEELGIPVARVRVPDPSTDATPFDAFTGSSRSTVAMGTAVQRAAADVARQARAVAAEAWGVPAEQLKLADGCIVCSDRRRMPLAAAVALGSGTLGGEIVGRGYSAPGLGGGMDGDPLFWEVAMGSAEIELDADTGELAIRRYTSLSDVGRAIDRQNCEAQEAGAVAQGLGHTLFEEVVDTEGRLLNAGALDYRVPRMADLPREDDVVLVENGDGPGPLGAKGAGESAIVPVAPAVANALFRLTGVRLHDLPLTPERVWRALARRDVP